MTGTEFARRRIAIDLSQKDLATVLDVSERQCWETAPAVPTIAECALEYLTTIDLDTELPICAPAFLHREPSSHTA